MALEACFSNHIYQCGNTLYRQLVGGAIGDSITGVVARILMDRWADRLKELLEQVDVDVYLLLKYVDYINLATAIVPIGYKWEKGRNGEI